MVHTADSTTNNNVCYYHRCAVRTNNNVCYYHRCAVSDGGPSRGVWCVVSLLVRMYAGCVWPLFPKIVCVYFVQLLITVRIEQVLHRLS